jgi:hypothetical protein
MATMKRRTFQKEFVQIPNDTAKMVEAKNNPNPISLEALGLLTNLRRYSDNWELHKTELYVRFAFNKERSVKKAWNELIKAKFIIEFKYRKGSKWEYVYIFDVAPYTDEQVEIIMAESREEYGKISGLQNADLKMKTSQRRPQNVGVNKKELKKNGIKEKLNKDKNNFVNKEENPSGVENYFSKGQMLEAADKFYSEFARGRWSKNQWFTITDKLTTEISDRCIAIKNLEAYIYAALKQIAYKHDYKNGKVEFEFETGKGEVPFYDWLNNWDMEDL